MLKTVEQKAQEGAVALLEEALAAAKAGKLLNVVVIGEGHDPEGAPAYFCNHVNVDLWRLLGAIEYGKMQIHTKILLSS